MCTNTGTKWLVECRKDLDQQLHWIASHFKLGALPQAASKGLCWHVSRNRENYKNNDNNTNCNGIMVLLLINSIKHVAFQLSDINIRTIVKGPYRWCCLRKSTKLETHCNPKQLMIQAFSVFYMPLLPVFVHILGANTGTNLSFFFLCILRLPSPFVWVHLLATTNTYIKYYGNA